LNNKIAPGNSQSAEEPLFFAKACVWHPRPSSKNHATVNASGGSSRSASFVLYPARGIKPSTQLLDPISESPYFHNARLYPILNFALKHHSLLTFPLIMQAAISSVHFN